MKNPIKLHKSAFGNKIYTGRVNINKGLFIGEKEDVTQDAGS